MFLNVTAQSNAAALSTSAVVEAQMNSTLNALRLLGDGKLIRGLFNVVVSAFEKSPSDFPVDSVHL